MNGYETSSTEDLSDPSDHAIYFRPEDLPDVLDSGLGKRPPFVEICPKRDAYTGSFIDEGNATLLRDNFSICCEAYFHRRHDLEYSPDDNREKLRQHIASPEFIAARALFLSAIEQERLPRLVFLLWELYGSDPNLFKESLQTLRALQSVPGFVLSNIEILYPNIPPTGLGKLKISIDCKIMELEKDRDRGSLDMLLPFLKTLSAKMGLLWLYHHQFSEIEFPFCRNEFPLSCKKEWLHKVWNEDAPDHWIVSPYEYGLNYFLYRELRAIDISRRFLLQKPEMQRPSHLSEVAVKSAASHDVEDETSANDAYIRLLFGVAGCGKTKRIFDILSANWGLYILPGGQSESLAGRIQQSDSILLWSTIETVIDSLGNVCEEGERRSWIDRLIEAFLACRLREFKRMYTVEYSSNTNKDLCTHWLQYQLTTSGVNDSHFERYFAIARHLPLPRVDLQYEKSDSDIFPNWLPRGRFYFCLDEFQSDFDRQAGFYSVPPGYKYNPAYHGLMHNVLYSARGIKLNQERQDGVRWKMILAGTSSYLSQVKRAANLPIPRQMRAQSDVYYDIHSKFEPIKNFQDEFPEFLLAHTDRVFFEAWAIIKTTYESTYGSGMALSSPPSINSEDVMDVDGGDRSSSARDCLQSSAILTTSGRHIEHELRCALLHLFDTTRGLKAEQIFKSLREKIRAEQQFITRIGLPLRGRHLWSSRYAQLVLAVAIQWYIQPSNEDFREELEHQVAKIESNVIDKLISNLKKLKKSNRLIYSNICRIAIRADALNKPTLFPDDYTGEMVTRGFAFAYSDPNSYHWQEGYVKIGEPLAIRAILRYLEHDEKGKIEFKRQMNEIVYMNQDNASSLGFSTEHYLATNFDWVFRRGVELISADRRDKILVHLQKSIRPIDDDANLWKSSCETLQIRDFELIQPAVDDRELGKNSSFVEWLEQPPDVPKFCFPSTKAGPDLAFILHRNSKENQAGHQINKILVTVQSKTAEQKIRNGFDVTETIHTIDPNLWYISSPTCVPATKDVVKRWGTDPSCLILSILVVTSDFVTSGADQTCKTFRKEKWRRQRCEQQHPKKSSEASGDGVERVQSPDKAQVLLENLPNVNYAFCYMDRDMTQDLFGDTFTKLIDMAKKKPMK